MKYKKISDKVQSIIDGCNNDFLELVDGTQKSKKSRLKIQPILYNQRETIRKINFYINNRYTERNDDAIFWNISNPRITHFTKLISPDTKDFYPYGIGQLNFLQSWALRKKVKQWFDDEQFYRTLNDTAEGESTYGSTVWKKFKEKGKTVAKECKLDNLYFDQSIEWIKNTDIVELHDLSVAELWDKLDVWDNVQKLLDKDFNRYDIWEFTGYWQEAVDDRPQYKRVIGYGFGDEETILWTETLKSNKDCPYIDYHLGRYRGRWLRVGVVERLFDLQERANQLVNQNAASTEIASLLLLKSNNADATGNVFEQAVNGQIVGDESLQQISLQNPGLAQFIQEMNMINIQADKLCLTPEIVQGESSPSNTTFRGIAVVNAGAITAFKNYRQDLFEKIANFLLTDIFPTLVSSWNREQMIEMSEDDEDVEAYDKAVVEYIKKQALLNGNVISPELEAQIVGNVQENINRVGRKVEIGKDFFNFKWGFKMMATDESVDKNTQNDAYFNALQMIGVNPALIDIPLFKQYLENNGISPHKITPMQKKELQQSQSGAGQMPEPKQPDKLLAQAQQLK